MEERYELAKNRISEIVYEDILPSDAKAFFSQEAVFLLMVFENYEKALNPSYYMEDIEELRRINHELYEYSIKCSLDNVYLWALDAELKATVPFSWEGDLFEIVIRAELFLEFYSAYCCACEEEKNPDDEDLRSILYFFVNDYSGIATEKKIGNYLSLENTAIEKIVLESDWNDLRSLYRYGEYITEVEEKTLQYLCGLEDSVLSKMADTYTEGFRIGFEVTNKDLSKKKLVEIRYHVGFEPMVVKAIENFKKLGLKPVVRRSVYSLLQGRAINRIGIEGAVFDKQYLFDHKNDMSLILDKAINTVRLEALEKSFELKKKEASLMAGPAVIEVFGEEPFDFKKNEFAPDYSDEQQKILLKYSVEAGQIQRSYIPEEERSFTIIAFPTPEIGPEFSKIFDEVIKINTLDYKLYRDVQQKLIDTLDKGEYCLVKGCNGNKTNIKVNLWKLKNPSKETIFENCVADVNIPVGEVFTSPVLEGTEGRLFVSRVFLNGLEYKNLDIHFENGFVSKYSCDNFDNEEDNKKYIKDNILFHHDSLPIGEFAIGTNTVAYMVGRKYDIENKLPILIAEKTGPHFAVGDTCYSNAEDVKVYNPDGKEIVARENSCSLKRHENPDKAYYNCHTDITIPYDELGELSVVTKENEVILIIENGKFVLPGTEVLNEAY